MYKSNKVEDERCSHEGERTAQHRNDTGMEHTYDYHRIRQEHGDTAGMPANRRRIARSPKGQRTNRGKTHQTGLKSPYAGASDSHQRNEMVRVHAPAAQVARMPVQMRPVEDC